jgi:hypothetical protein
MPMIVLVALLASGIAWPVSAAAQLIEPTRTLRGSGEETGTLNLYSEPPGLEVRIDGDPIGKTPVRSHRLPAGTHVLRIRESEREIHVAPDSSRTISWFKGAFIEVPARKPEPEPVPEPAAPQRPPTPPQPSPPAPAPNDPFYWPLNPKGPIY